MSKDDIELDLVGQDNVPEVIIKKTNGYTPYVSLKWLLTGAGVVVTTIVGYFVVV